MRMSKLRRIGKPASSNVAKSKYARASVVRAPMDRSTTFRLIPLTLLRTESVQSTIAFLQTRAMRQKVADVDATGEEEAMLSLSHNWTRGRRLDLNWPTRITLSRILLVVPFVVCMLHINAPDLTESQDSAASCRGRHLPVHGCQRWPGSLLARRSGQLTRLGAFLDPAADKLLMTATCILLISQRGHVGCFVPPTVVVMTIIGKDVLLVAGFVVAYLMTSHIYIAPAFAGKLATFVQLLMGAAVLLAPNCREWFRPTGTAGRAMVVRRRHGCRSPGCLHPGWSPLYWSVRTHPG